MGMEEAGWGNSLEKVMEVTNIPGMAWKKQKR
jgi:hypothetical protein